MKSPIAVVEKSLGPVGFGVASLVGEGALGFGLGVGIGELYVRHQDKWIGRNAPWVTMALGKGVAALIQIVTGGNGATWMSLANTVGQTGASCTGLEVGLDHARKKVAGVFPKKTAVGELPPAAAGRGLTWSQLEEIAKMS